MLASVNPSDCRWSTERGDSEERVLWRDPGYDASHDAFYYARVVQNPTCRWTTYDSLRLGVEPPADVPALVAEMAWSSPIWLAARASNRPSRFIIAFETPSIGCWPALIDPPEARGLPLAQDRPPIRSPVSRYLDLVPEANHRIQRLREW